MRPAPFLRELENEFNSEAETKNRYQLRSLLVGVCGSLQAANLTQSDKERNN